MKEFQKVNMILQSIALTQSLSNSEESSPRGGEREWKTSTPNKEINSSESTQVDKKFRTTSKQ